MHIDLNADIGEHTTPEGCACEVAMLPYLSSVSITCGFHAGDPALMRRLAGLAAAHDCAVGAHPGLPDRAGGGRVPMDISPREAADMVAYQVGALAALAAQEGVLLRHVKLHGALYHMAACSAPMARAVATSVARIQPDLRLFVPPASELAAAGVDAGLIIVREGFADRRYEPDGTLASRDRDDALITEPQEVVAQVLRMVREGRVTARDASDVALQVDTICLHGDTPGAAVLARQVSNALREAGITIAASGAVSARTTD